MEERMAPRKGKKSVEDVDATVVKRYMALGEKIKPLEKERKGLGEIIKKWLGDKTEEDVEGIGTITYGYDADKEEEVVDLLALKQDYPKVYAKVVTMETKKGTRKLKMPGKGD